jgi:hypothetical protein
MVYDGGNLLPEDNVVTVKSLLLVSLLAPMGVSAQSLIFPAVLDQHYPHLATKPVISGAIYGAVRLAHLSPTVATVAALAGPEVFSQVRTRIVYGNGHLLWQEKAAWHDMVADTWAASLSILVLRLHGWKRVAAVAVWGTVEFAGAQKWSRP